MSLPDISESYAAGHGPIYFHVGWQSLVALWATNCEFVSIAAQIETLAPHFYISGQLARHYHERAKKLRGMSESAIGLSYESANWDGRGVFAELTQTPHLG